MSNEHHDKRAVLMTKQDNTIEARKAMRDRMRIWAKRNGLEPADPKHRCLHWLGRGRCGVSICEEQYGKYRWMDHTTAWKRDGKPVLCCQPYHINEDELREIADACRRFSLEASIHGDGFYGYGTVCLILEGQRQ